MKVQRIKDHEVIDTDTCGQIREILSNGESPSFDLAVRLICDLLEHFHKNFCDLRENSPGKRIANRSPSLPIFYTGILC